MAEKNDKAQGILNLFSNTELFSALGKDLKSLTGTAVKLEENVTKGKPLEEVGNPMVEMGKIAADIGVRIEQRGEKIREASRIRSEALQQNLDQRRKRLESYAKRKRPVVAGKGDNFVVAGQVTDKASGNGIPNLIVKAIDKDRKYDDMLGTTRTDALGYYRIEYSEADFKEKDNKPETFIEVMDDNNKVLFRSTRSFIEKAGKTEKIDAEIDGSAVPDKLALGQTVSKFVDTRLNNFETKRQTMDVRKVVATEKIRMAPELKQKKFETEIVLARPTKMIQERMLKPSEPIVAKDETVKIESRKVVEDSTKEVFAGKVTTSTASTAKATTETKAATTKKKTARKPIKKPATKKTKKK